MVKGEKQKKTVKFYAKNLPKHSLRDFIGDGLKRIGKRSLPTRFKKNLL